MSPLSEATKTCVYRNLKVHPVSSFALRISGLHTFGRKQRFLRFSTVHHGMYGSIYESSCHRQVFCLAVILMHLFTELPGWIVLINYFDILDTRLCLTCSPALYSG